MVSASEPPLHPVAADYVGLVDDSAVTILPHALRIIIELGVAEAMAAGASNVDEIAKQTGVDADALYRLLRAVASAGFLIEQPGRRFTLTDLGRQLTVCHERSLLRSLVNTDSIRSWLMGAESIRTGRPAFESAFGEEFFQRTAATAHAEFFARMRERSSRLYPRLAEAVDWSGSSTVMDVGGSDGFVLSTILQHAPGLSGVLFDRPATVAAARPHIERLPTADRMSSTAGDFFVSLPGGADSHVLASVLHDWADDQCLKILQNSWAALPRGGRILIVEMVIPDDGSFHPSKWSDLGMMILMGGRERTEVEFRDLLSGCGFTAAVRRDVPDSVFSVIEARKPD